MTNRDLYIKELKERKLIALKRFDAKNNVDFSECINREKLESNSFHGYGYEPSFDFKPVFHFLQIVASDSIVDLGCGKGYAMYLLSFYPFDRIAGVEINNRLIEVAQKNLSTLCPQRECFVFYNEDVYSWDNYYDYNYFYLFNPFDEYVIGEVARKVKSVAIETKTERMIIYQAPKHKDIFLNLGYDLLFIEGINTVLCYDGKTKL